MQPMGDALQPGSFRLVYSLRQPWYTAVSLMLQSIAYWLHFGPVISQQAPRGRPVRDTVCCDARHQQSGCVGDSRALKSGSRRCVGKQSNAFGAGLPPVK